MTSSYKPSAIPLDRALGVYIFIVIELFLKINSSCTKWQKTNSFGQAGWRFMVKKQGTCSKAVSIIPAPTGAAHQIWPKSSRIIYRIRNNMDIVRATVLNTENSFSLSFLASLSMGLQRKIWIEDAMTKQVNIMTLTLVVTTLIKNKKMREAALRKRDIQLKI